MPSWKKLVTSGSDAYLNSLNVANSVTASFFSGSFIGSLEGTSSYAVTASYVDFDNVAGIHSYTSSISGSITTLSSSFLQFSESYNSGSFSGSFFGDGSGLTGIGVSFEELTTVTASFSNTGSLTVNHSFDSENVVAIVYEQDKKQIIPKTIQILNQSQVYIEFVENTSGYVVVMRGGHIVSGIVSNVTGSFSGSFVGSLEGTSSVSLNAISSSYALTASYVLGGSTGVSSSYSVTSSHAITSSYISYQNIDNIPAGIVSGSSQLSGFVSASGVFISGQLIVGTGNNSVSSSNLLFIDTVNERVGVKTTSPQYPFHYVQDTGNALAVYEKQGGAAVFYEAQDTRAALGTVGSHPLLFAINSSEVSRINTSGVYEGDVSGSITGEFIPTAHIIPNTTNTRDLGSSTIKFRDLHLGGTGRGAFSGSFIGDGSGLTGIVASGGGSVYQVTGTSNTSIIPVSGSNQATSVSYSNVGGGINNRANGQCSTVAGGSANCACSDFSSILGGASNCINTLSGCRPVYSTIGGGQSNIICATGTTCNGHHVIGGGISNIIGSGGASAGCNIISGGCSNRISGSSTNIAVIAGGAINCVTAPGGNIGGGNSNCITQCQSTIAGGVGNQVLSSSGGSRSFIGGGGSNVINGAGGGTQRNVIVGGNGNCITATVGAFIGGGYNNTVSGAYSAILGGRVNSTSTFTCAFIVGSNLTATANCYTFVNNLCNVGGGTSDCRLKENVKPVTYGINELSRLQPVCYNFIDDDSKKTKYGFLAQCIQEVMPDLIYHHPTQTVNGEPVLQFDKDAVWASMVNALKELKNKNSELEERIQALESKS